jgi:hypothetical protein
MLEAVQLLRLPGRAVALVSAETAEAGERMGELRRLDAPPDPHRQAMGYAPRVPQSATGNAGGRVLGELG